MNSIRVLMTGATGFVGHWMKKTIPQGMEYIGIGRDAYDNGFLDWMVNVTHVVHLAPVLPDKIIEVARQHNARLLYCSSGIVYYPEVDTLYRQNKVTGEAMCKESGLDHVIARLFTFFGYGQNDDKAIVRMFKAAREGLPIQAYKGVTRSYMHGREMGRRMWKILLEGERGRAYDVGSRRPVTMERLARRIQAFTHCEIEYIECNVSMPYYVPRGDDGSLD